MSANGRTRSTTRRLLAGLALAGSLVLASATMAQSLEDLQHLSLEQLARFPVTSVSRRPEPLSQAPAAIYVITSEDIRRSGAITLTEVLRLAPNLEVARQDAQNYSVSARGFNSVGASNKLLVMVDDRSVYSPLSSGVFWDQLQPPLDDIERIEVISDPGDALWGANAVNGVINIITKHSRDTPGGLVDLKAGTVDQKFIPFIGWPQALPEGAFNICIVGRNPFGNQIERVASGQAIDGHPIKARYFSSLTGPSGCQVLYLARDDLPQVEAVLAMLRGSAVLTVTDGQSEPDAKGIINFLIADNRVRFEIDDAAAAASGLTISSKLLNIAVDVRLRK